MKNIQLDIYSDQYSFWGKRKNFQKHKFENTSHNSVTSGNIQRQNCVSLSLMLAISLGVYF